MLKKNYVGCWSFEHIIEVRAHEKIEKTTKSVKPQRFLNPPILLLKLVFIHSFKTITAKNRGKPTKMQPLKDMETNKQVKNAKNVSTHVDNMFANKQYIRSWSSSRESVFQPWIWLFP